MDDFKIAFGYPTEWKKHWIAAYDLYLLAEERGLTTVDLYYNRAVVKLKLGKTREACKDLEIAIKKGDTESKKIYDKFCNNADE